MLLSGTALAASDPAGVDTTDMPPELKGRETIVVKGQRIEQKLSDVSGSITVITEEDLDHQVATELTDVFKNEPGVSVTGSAGRPQNIIIRGMGGNRVLIIKDGVWSATVLAPTTSTTRWAASASISTMSSR